MGKWGASPWGNEEFPQGGNKGLPQYGKNIPNGDIPLNKT